MTRTQRRATFFVAIWLIVSIAVVVRIAHASDTAKPERHALAARVERFQGHGLRWWANRAVLARRDANHWRNVSEHQRIRVVTSVEPIYEHAAVLAAIAYGVDADTLIRKGRCESVNWTQFVSTRSSARGPWQFLTEGRARRYGDGVMVDGGTWATTPFFAFSPFDPFAAAMAAAYMHHVGRGGEWVCQ